MGYQTYGVNTGGLPDHLVRPLIEKYDIPFMVETGTASGDSARLAATMFKKVWTIELTEGFADIKDAPDNISFSVGDSTEILPQILLELQKLKSGAKHQYVLFYLDAHYCGDEPNESEYPECPVLKEIEIIAGYGEDAIIIIDDARLFFGQPPYPHDPTQWPSICEIFILLKEKFPYHHLAITDDYVLAIPLHVREAIDKEWRDRFHIRYPNDQDKLKEEVKNIYKSFLDYIR